MTKEQEEKIMVMTYSQVKGLLRAMCVAPYDIDKDDEFTSAMMKEMSVYIKGKYDIKKDFYEVKRQLCGWFDGGEFIGKHGETYEHFELYTNRFLEDFFNK